MNYKCRIYEEQAPGGVGGRHPVRRAPLLPFPNNHQYFHHRVRKRRWRIIPINQQKFSRDCSAGVAVSLPEVVLRRGKNSPDLFQTPSSDGFFDDITVFAKTMTGRVVNVKKMSYKNPQRVDAWPVSGCHDHKDFIMWVLKINLTRLEKSSK